jgi:hypothetical protein
MLFVNTTDLLGPDWRFLEAECPDPAIRWEIHSGRARGVLERAVPGIALGRYRAALAAARSARRAGPGTVLVAHLPLMAAATNLARRALCPAVPQVAFAFNFTDLPEGARRRYLAAALRGLDEIVVFSRFERPLYAHHLGLPEARIRFLPWAMEPPAPGPENPAAGQGPYLCAIGGEGRDYALLARVMEGMPDRRLVIVGRPHSVAGLRAPPNVTVFTNLPLAKTWAIAAGSGGMVIPLRTDTTACGHITLIGAQMLGIPLVITRSRGVEDYVAEGETARLVPAGDAPALAAAVAALADDPATTARLAETARTRARRENALAVWVDYFRALAERFGGGTPPTPTETR